MERRERMMATLRGDPVDRPPFNFYEITGFDADTWSEDPFNIHSDPSWRPVIRLAADETDRIVRRNVHAKDAPPDPAAELTSVETWLEGDSRYTRRTIRARHCRLTSLARRDRDVNTTWTLEHLLKDVDDLRAWIDLPAQEYGTEPDTSVVLEAEAALGNTGTVLIDTSDPLCMVAHLFSMEAYTVTALTEPALFHQALEKAARYLYAKTECVARALPGRLWRICGPEYASPPYLPPRLFREYVVRYVTPMVEMIHRHGGYARIHSHGRLKDIMDDIVSTGCMGLDPIEPPPQGDVELAWMRERYGEQLVLFGNIEASDIENLSPDLFEQKVRQSLDEGMSGRGRGFVLQPSACPYGRKLPSRAMKNYERIVEVMQKCAY